MTRKSTHRPTVLGALAGLGLTLTLLPASPAHAQTFVPCNNITALRNAITASNASDENITLAPFCTYTISTTVSPDNGLPQVTGSYTINGYNTTVRRSAAAGTPDFRVFDVEAGGDLTLNSIHVRGGNVPGDSGGGIRVSGTGSTLTVQSGSVRDNNAGTGGGIHTRDGGAAILSYTLVSGNTATGSGGGGGISHAGSTLRLNISRVQGNTAAQEGGGLRASGTSTATLVQSTVTGNTANGLLGGGGIFEGTSSQVSLIGASVTGNVPNDCRPAGAVPGCVN
ncbi:hypothetical protein SUDANB105_01756 [Streptomyces sp. enrichment culture]|uniref:hypothetical protein n=1 Tax=Streptomyces sp. enrichment culture TaxID=1795815 RepID=UPI003F55C65B